MSTMYNLGLHAHPITMSGCACRQYFSLIVEFLTFTDNTIAPNQHSLGSWICKLPILFMIMAYPPFLGVLDQVTVILGPGSHHQSQGLIISPRITETISPPFDFACMYSCITCLVCNLGSWMMFYRDQDYTYCIKEIGATTHGCTSTYHTMYIQ